MLRIGFIQPSSDYLFDPFRGDPFTHLAILTIIEDAFGDRVEPLLIDLRGIKREYALFHIPECDIYLHSIYTLDYHEQISVVGCLKKQYPKSVHIAGGPHVAEFTRECSRFFDSLILGEGEETVVRAINDFLNSRLQRLYQQETLIDINAYPHWNRKFLPKSSVARKNIMTLKNKPGFENLPGTTVMFSRGCPFSCHFCDIQRFKKGTPSIRFREPELITKEIEYLKRDYGVQGINIVDEIGFPLKRERAVKHIEAIGKSGIVWRGQCRADGITPELAKLAFDSGCVALGIGVESVIQKSLDLINKAVKVEEAKKTIATIRSIGIEARIYLIIGLPGEPEDIVERTWSFIEEAKPELVHLSLLTVRPGTEFFRHPERFGIKRVNTDWQNTMHMHGRFSDEKITLTFEYNEETPWGKSLPSDTIVKNYLELQGRLKEHGLASLPVAPYM